MDLALVFLAVFVLSALGVLAMKAGARRDEVQSQFVVTGTILLVFYVVCFFSGICTILNFFFKWIF
jgi:hypothetical protein